MSERRRATDGLGIDPQDYGAMRGNITNIGKVLDVHLRECAETNKAVAERLNQLVLAIVVLAILTLGTEGLSLLKAVAL